MVNHSAMVVKGISLGWNLVLNAVALVGFVASTSVARAASARVPASNSSFGSGIWGKWERDADTGASVYAHIAPRNQTMHEAAKVGASYPGGIIKLPNEQWFQIGNERIVMLANQWGGMEVRTDEGGPHFLGGIDRIGKFAPAQRGFGQVWVSWAPLPLMRHKSAFLEVTDTPISASDGISPCGDFGTKHGRCSVVSGGETPEIDAFNASRSFGAAFQTTQLAGWMDARRSLKLLVNVTYVPAPGDRPSVGIFVEAEVIGPAGSSPVDLRVDVVCGGLVRHMDSVWQSTRRTQTDFSGTVFGQPVMLGASHYSTRGIVQQALRARSADHQRLNGREEAPASNESYSIADPSDTTVLLARTWLPFNGTEAAQFEAMQEQLWEKSFHSPWTNRFPEPPIGGSLYNERPHATFLAPLPGSSGVDAGGAIDCTALNQDAFNRNGRSSQPLSGAVRTADACNILSRRLIVTVSPEPSSSIAATAFVWGYVDGNGTDAELLSRAETEVKQAANALMVDSGCASRHSKAVSPATTAKWAAHAATLQESVMLTSAAGPDAPIEGRFSWLSRELEWHSGYLLGARTKSSYWNEAVLDQGTQYRYSQGFQGAMRDPLQHSMPLVLAAPDTARSILRLSLKQLQDPSRPSPLGHQRFLSPYALISQGMLATFNLIPSDQELWLPMLAAESALAARNFSVLREQIPMYYPDGGNGQAAASRTWTVDEALWTAVQYSMRNVSVGEHGLMRLQTSDWSDTYTQCKANATYNTTRFWEVVRRGESVLNAATASYSMVRYAELLEGAAAAGQAASPQWAERAAAARQFAEGQRKAMQEVAWLPDKGYFMRAWLGPANDSLGWRGEDYMVATPTSWALMGEVVSRYYGGVKSSREDELSVATGSWSEPSLPGQDHPALRQLDRMMDSLDALRAPSPIGAPQMSAPSPLCKSAPGEQENGGVWQSLNGPMIEGLARQSRALRLDWAGSSDNREDRGGLDEAPVPSQAVRASQLALDEALKNTLAHQAAAYPEYWAGIWSSADSVASYFSNEPGVSYWPDAPVLCTHRHAWSVQAFVRVAGLFQTAQGYDIAPSALAGDLAAPGHGWCLRSALAAVCADASGTWRGWQMVVPPAGGVQSGLRGGAEAWAPAPVLFRFSMPLAALPTNASLVVLADGKQVHAGPMRLRMTQGATGEEVPVQPRSGGSGWVFMQSAANVSVLAGLGPWSDGQGMVNVSWTAFAMQ